MAEPSEEIEPLGGVDALLEVTARLDRLTREAAEIEEEISGAAGTDLVPVGGRNPATLKRSMAVARAAAARKRAEIEQAQGEMKALLEAKMSEARAAMEPLKKMVDLMTSGIEAISLYLGTQEDIVVLRDGEPAPAGTQIVVRQLVLSMDQEAAVLAEEGGIDAMGIDLFDEWILADPAHLAQVLPEAKGVVALVPRITRKDYGDPWAQRSMDEANSLTYFLIRNGEKLYRYCANFRVGTRLVPTSTEFTALFRERRHNYTTGEDEWIELRPGTYQWTKAEEGADARKQHYMKIALILQGLVDRTTVFHPLPGPTVSFLGEDDYFADRVRIVTDAEATLGTGQETFRNWQKRLNALLRPGMRVVCAFNSEEFRGWREERGGGNSRLNPVHADPPRSGRVYKIEERRPSGDLVIRYERTDKRYGYEHGDWGRWGSWPYKTRASCVLRPDDRFVIPFDLATVEEMEGFLGRRTERGDYLAMFPVLKAAIAARRAEEAEEAPFRQLLASVISARNGVSVAEAMDDVDELVAWWKLANRHHRPLLVADANHAKTVDAIVAEHRRRMATRKRGADEGLVDTLRAEHPDAVLVARKHSGTYVVLVAMSETTNLFVSEVEYSATGKRKSSADWKLPGARPNRWTTLWESPRWAEWDRGATLALHLTGPERQAMVAEAIEKETAQGREPFAAGYNAKDRALLVWSVKSRPVIDSDRLASKRPKDIEVAEGRFDWKRTTGQRLIMAERKWWSGTVTWDRSNAPWSRKGVDLLWSDDPALDVVIADHERYVQADAEHSRLSNLAYSARRRMADAWEARAEAAEHARFLEEYLDEALWEGHRKLKVRDWDCPHVHDDGIKALVDHLVESGHELRGMAVAEAVAIYEAETGRKADVAEAVLDLSF